MRYLLSARVRLDRRTELLGAIESGTFGEGFPYGDLGATLCEGKVDPGGTVRWVEVCYCREAYGLAMEEELPYFEAFLTDMTVTDARDPAHCVGYPACNDCDCTKKVRPKGEPFLDYLRRIVSEALSCPQRDGRPTRWLGWRGEVTAEEASRNRLAGMEDAKG